jgi:hypothetical protein
LELGVLLIFCLGWPQTTILLISTSWVVGIIGMNHCAQLRIKCFDEYVIKTHLVGKTLSS